ERLTRAAKWARKFTRRPPSRKWIRSIRARQTTSVGGLGARAVRRCLGQLALTVVLGRALGGLRFFGLDHQGDGADARVVLAVARLAALGGPAHVRDATGRGALDHAVLGDEEEVLVLADDQRTGEAPLLLGQFRGEDAFRAAALDRVFRHRRALAVAV